MPYMNLDDPETFDHLIQLFLAAHPEWQSITADLRRETGQAHAYFVSEALMEQLVAWALERHMITRKTARGLLQTSRLVLRTSPEDVVPVTRRRLPLAQPEWQPTVLASDLFRFVYCQEPGPREPECALTLPAAITLVERVIEDPGGDTPAQHADRITPRAQVLLAWLQSQVDA